MATDQTGIQFTIRRKLLTLFGAKFHIFDATGNLIGFCKQKAFKLKEDIRLYSDETMSEERLAINARSMIDISAAYDVVDSQSQVKLGALQRKGLKSLFRDEWILLDENDQEIGIIKEDSMFAALIRRFLANIIPQKFHLRDGDGHEMAEFHTHFNPFVHRMTVNIDPDTTINPFLILAGGVLLVAIEGRQSR